MMLMITIITNFIGLLRTSFLLDKKRGQGLSITTIILAVLGLIIIAGIVALLTNRFADFDRGLDTAPAITVP
tara:strand:- start:144 stop:359 length:216 start_codon:yes stop_codon:yes gene_type:complete